MQSKTKIKIKARRKTNPDVVETINLANKNESWRNVAQKISVSRRRSFSLNLKEIDKETKEGDTVIVCGKVLGVGSLNKKIKICALRFSESAIDKIKKAKSEAGYIVDEIKTNPKAQGVKLLS